MSNNRFYCLVCGFKQIEPPWGEEGKNPSHDICDCCGVEFGYEDWTNESTKSYRKKWIEGGAKWFQPNSKPVNWNLEEQLRSIGDEFS